MNSEGITVMLDLRSDPGDAARAALETTLGNRPGIRSARFSPFVRRVLTVQYDARAIRARDVGRMVDDALGVSRPNTRVVGM